MKAPTSPMKAWSRTSRWTTSAITMLVLSNCDRFLVKVSEAGVERLNTDHAPIPLIQLNAENFVNVALRVFEDDSAPAGPEA